MNRTIKSFTTGRTTSGMMNWYAAILDCSHWKYSKGWTPFPADVVVGSQVDCETCDNHAKACAMLETFDVASISYMRFSGRWAYPDQNIFGHYNAYTRDSSSPTGVMLLFSVPAIKEIDAIIDRRRIGTLSPTEGR